MIEVNPTDDWAEEQIEQIVDEFSDWIAGEDSPLSESAAEQYLWIKGDELSERAAQAIRDYAREFQS